MGYIVRMPTVYQSGEFSNWLRRLKDNAAAARITSRIRRLEAGNLGDVRSVGGGIMEMRIDYGPGYRIYFTNRGAELVILLCGGDKRSQQRDIERARTIAEEF